MRGLVVACAALLVLPGICAAQDKPAEPPTPEQAADQALAASKSKDAARLKELAARDTPDPWLVADELCARGEHDTADSFARAAPRADVEKLPAYVAASRGRPDDAGARKALAAADAALQSGRADDALAVLESAKPGDGGAVAIAIEFQRGSVLQGLRRLDESVAAFRKAADSAEAVGWFARQSKALNECGFTAFERSDFRTACDVWERRAALEQRRAHPASVAASMGNAGAAYAKLGDYARALDLEERALEMKEELGDRADIAGQLLNLGSVHLGLGDYAKALSFQERALALVEKDGDVATISQIVGNIGATAALQGDLDKALAFEERALALEEKAGDRAGVASSLMNIGAIHHRRGEFADALSFNERALAIEEELGDRAGVARLLGNIGAMHMALGQYAEALAFLERGLAQAEELGDLEVVVGNLTKLAQTQLACDRPKEALDAARRALVEMRTLVHGVGDEQGALAREQFSEVFAAGAIAAARLGDAAAAATFLENGRAGALLEALHGREALRESAIPQELRTAEAAARAAESAAAAALRDAVASRKVAVIAAARKDVTARQEELRDVIFRIQREAKSAAGLLYPQADPLDAIRARLQKSEALVLYLLLPKSSMAVVATHDGARLVALGAIEDVEAACRAFAPDDAAGDPTPAAAALRKLVVAPLGLDEKVTRVLVSPDGALSYVPFSLLLDGRDVSYVPSGTTLGLLLGDAALRGEGVLAVGDPDHPSGAGKTGGAAKLGRLPASAAEAKSVGSVVLLGKEATKPGVAAALAKTPRWRAVHFACHGLIDPERAMFSSLALTPAGGDDGLLTALEVFQMKVPADLVVLSACETGKGKLYKAEGIVGLTRAFMFAGAPRVLVSLWKVDDQATAALMAKFYEGFKKDVPAARALRDAQAHVRAQEKWKHPFYWAAWSLWGLPD